MIPRKVLIAKHILGSRIQGKFVQSGATTFSISASVQSVTGAALANMSFITSDSGRVYKLITNDALRTLKEGPDADVVEIDGKDHRVLEGVKWDNHILDHNIYIVQELFDK